MQVWVWSSERERREGGREGGEKEEERRREKGRKGGRKRREQNWSVTVPDDYTPRTKEVKVVRSPGLGDSVLSWLASSGSLRDPVSNKPQNRWYLRDDRQVCPLVPTFTCVHKYTQEYTHFKMIQNVFFGHLSYTTNIVTLKYTWILPLELGKSLGFYYHLSSPNPELQDAPNPPPVFFFLFEYLHDATNENSVSELTEMGGNQHTGTLNVLRKAVWSLCL